LLPAKDVAVSLALSTELFMRGRKADECRGREKSGLIVGAREIIARETADKLDLCAIAAGLRDAVNELHSGKWKPLNKPFQLGAPNCSYRAWIPKRPKTKRWYFSIAVTKHSGAGRRQSIY